MNITADTVKQLRERTGASMMECKKALVETKGDLDAAAELMRKQDWPRPDKRPTRGPQRAWSSWRSGGRPHGRHGRDQTARRTSWPASRLRGFAQAVAAKALARAEPPWTPYWLPSWIAARR